MHTLILVLLQWPLFCCSMLTLQSSTIQFVYCFSFFFFVFVSLGAISFFYHLIVLMKLQALETLRVHVASASSVRSVVRLICKQQFPMTVLGTINISWIVNDYNLFFHLNPNYKKRSSNGTIHYICYHFFSSHFIINYTKLNCRETDKHT